MKNKNLHVIKICIAFVLIISLSLVIISCNKTNDNAGDKAKDNIENEVNKTSRNLGLITIASLTDREKGLVRSLGGDTTYIFDVNLDKHINSDWVELWIDHYEKGVLKEPSRFLGFGLTIGEKELLTDTFIFSIESSSNDTNLEKWVLATNGCSSTSFKVKDSKFNGFSLMSNDNIEVLEDTVLNLLILKKGENSNYLYNNVFSDEDALKKDIAETEELYVLRCKFSKNNK